MKTNIIFLKKSIFAVLLTLVFVGCENLDRPTLGDYPVDKNPPGGPLKFYVPFDNPSSDPLRWAVDEIRANFPKDNPLTQIEGVNGKGMKGAKGKFIDYFSPNDFANYARSFTISFWSKHDVKTQTEFIFSLVSDNWAKASMFILAEGTNENPVLKLFIDEQPVEGGSDKWFDFLNVKDLYDNQWHHITFVYDSTTSKLLLYKDGVAIEPVSQWTNHGSVKLNVSKIKGFRIGGSGDQTQDWMNSWEGGLDQFRMYASALTQKEINDLYTQKL